MSRTAFKSPWSTWSPSRSRKEPSKPAEPGIAGSAGAYARCVLPSTLPPIASLTLEEVADRIGVDGWRWVHDQRPDLFDGVNEAERDGEAEALDRLLREALAAFEEAKNLPTLTKLAEDAIAAVHFVDDRGDVTLEREIRQRVRKRGA